MSAVSADVTVTAPATPSEGDWFGYYASASDSAFAYRAKLNRNGNTILGETATLPYDMNTRGDFVVWRYLNGTWVPVQQRLSGITTTPPYISGLTAWFDASDSTSLFNATSGGSNTVAGGDVQRWQDKSGNSWHVTEGSNPPTLQTSVLNGLSVVRFDGTNDILKTSSNFTITGNPAYSVFAVFRKTTNTKGNVFGWGSSATALNAAGYYDDGSSGLIAYAGGNSFNISVGANNTWFILSIVKSAGAINTTHTVRRNRTSVATSGHATSTPSISSNPLTIGRWSTYDPTGSLGAAFAGDIAELVIFNTALSTTSGGDMERMEKYLGDKWGL